MPFRHCRHVKEDGHFCQAAALHQRDYCRFHLRALGRRMRMARALARREPYRIVLPLLEDINAVQVAIMQVLDALGAGALDEKRGKLMLYGLRQASINLRSARGAACLAVPDQQSGAAVCAEDYPGFEEEFGLPQDLDLSQPPEVVFPPAAATASGAVVAGPSPYRSKPFRFDQVAPEDVELEEIFRTRGEDAYRQREKELTAKAMKEVFKHKGIIQQAKYVVEADRRNKELMFGTPEEQACNKAEVERNQAEAMAQKKAQLDADAAAAQGEVARKSPESTPASDATAVTAADVKSGTD